MRFIKIVSLFFWGTCAIINAQSSELVSSLTIDEALSKSANAVVRLDETKIEISNVKSLKENYRRIVTVLNKSGNKHVGAYVGYDSSIAIKKLGAIIYDAFGNEIEKVKKSDFMDESAVSNFSLYEDNRVKYLEYTPASYPYTVEFFYETNTENTAYIASWSPLEGYLVSTENSRIEITYDESLGVKTQEKNFEGYDITGSNENGVLLYEAKDIVGVKHEAYSPALNKIRPLLRVAGDTFFYEGYYGESENWKDLGAWMYKELLQNRTTVSEVTKAEIRRLVSGVEDPIERAKIVYQYVQDNTRYISVQEGIGGIQPIDALKVDQVKYGDCKGLTNYTKALMDVAEVKSYYTRVYASDQNVTDIDKEFVSFVGQTNHVILNIPNGTENIWLECTSQKSPFGYIANFTDDRDVFVIRPDGGEIVHTKAYGSKDNYLKSEATVNLNNEGGFKAHYKSLSGGTRYSFRLNYLKGEELKEQKIYYKDYWSYINELSLDKIQLKDDRNRIEMQEDLELSAVSYLVDAGDKMLFTPNVFKRSTNKPPKYSNRKLPFVIERGYYNEDVYTINLPETLTIKELPEPKEIKTEFGTYKVSIEKISDSQMIYKRSLEVHKGSYPKEAYKAYRSFRRKIIKSDKSSIVLYKI